MVPRLGVDIMKAECQLGDGFEREGSHENHRKKMARRLETVDRNLVDCLDQKYINHSFSLRSDTM
jgi:hypothetical protein